MARDRLVEGLRASRWGGGLERFGYALQVILPAARGSRQVWCGPLSRTVSTPRGFGVFFTNVRECSWLRSCE